MNGAISNIDALERFFRGANAPFFTLSYYNTQSPTGQGNVILRNVKEGNIDNSWAMLKGFVQDQTGFGRAQLHLITYETEKSANTPSGRTNIDMVGSNTGNQVTPGIGSMPSGYVDEAKIQSMLDDREKVWKMERKIEDLEAQIDAPGDFWDKGMAFLDKVGSTPVGMMIAAKFLGAPMPPMQAVNGVHNPDNADAPDGDDVERELDDLDALARSHGMTLKQFLSKTATLARSQPGVVQMLVNE